MSEQKVYLLLGLCVLFWSGNFILGRFVSGDIQAVELAFFRWFFVIILTIPLLFKIDIKKVITIYKKNFIFLTFLAIVGITLFNTVLYIALHTTTATNALLINSIIPILILLFSFLILKSKITKVQTTGIVISTFGVIFLVLKGDLTNIFHLKFTHGDLWVIVSSLLWATYSTFIKLKPKDLNHVELFILVVYIGFIFLLPWYLSQGYSLDKEIMILKDNWYFFIYVSVFASLLSFYFWHIGIDTIGAERTGQFTHLMPLFGAILAFIFLGEVPYLYHLIGALFIALGIYLSLFIKK
ncbi:DMT family transporter [Halarcobacter ebronensis]|uniref:EamA family transporter n=1 Tax=Halarcobacter ebronensis TaxID=1462615 RepID=A0A4Q1AVC7_9BACT|nr:DMT family transporter [Halarcobacter ebronensis]QKF82120.1 EamA/RhaT family transporter [Halarcobacter ebronensis]RXK04051.1 EamA family transporter [Halarcobacter ebronensis]